jgi:hypothetical protein
MCFVCVQTAAQADREQDDAEHGPQDAGRRALAPQQGTPQAAPTQEAHQ